MAAHDATYSGQPATPEEDAARNQLRRRLEAAIELLPPIYRCVLILRAVQGLDVEDTAAALQVSQDVSRPVTCGRAACCARTCSPTRPRCRWRTTSWGSAAKTWCGG